MGATASLFLRLTIERFEKAVWSNRTASSLLLQGRSLWEEDILLRSQGRTQDVPSVQAELGWRFMEFVNRLRNGVNLSTTCLPSIVAVLRK
jgi:hypothetical protein